MSKDQENADFRVVKSIGFIRMAEEIERLSRMELNISVALAESDNGGTLESLQEDIRDALRGGPYEREWK